MLNVLLKVWYQRPQIYYNPQINNSDNVNDYIHSAYCGHHSDMSFGWPSHSIMLQATFDWTIFFTIFYTGKNSNLSKSLHSDLHNQRLSIVTKSSDNNPKNILEKAMDKSSGGSGYPSSSLSSAKYMPVHEDDFSNDLLNWTSQGSMSNKSARRKYL